MSQLVELQRFCEQLQQQNSQFNARMLQLEECNKELTRDNDRFLKDAKTAAAQVNDLQEANADLRTQLQKSQDELEALMRRVFGRTSERFLGDAAGQMLLGFDSEDDIEDARAGILQALEEYDEQAATKSRKRRPRRGTGELFPESLERREVIVDLPDDEKEGLKRIGEDVRETLHFERPVLYVVKKVFPKYVVPNEPEAGVLQAPRPASLVSGDRYDTSMATESITAKMWVYRGLTVPLNIFDFTVSRHGDGPDLFLIDNNYEGTLIGDCYGANTGIMIRSSGAIVHAACNAHARRKFEAALDNHKRHATFVLEAFTALYDIEDEGRHLDAAARLDLRERRSRPIWDSLRTYIDTQMTDISKKEKIGEARGYLLNQWDGLVRYLDDGSLPMDNNLSEQLMRQVALGRKNWLFVGSVPAGYRAADLMTLVSSAHRNDLDVWAYVKNVLDQLLAGNVDYESLRPDTWKQSHPESIRTYRDEERRQTAARRDRTRLQRRLQRLKQKTDS